MVHIISPTVVEIEIQIHYLTGLSGFQFLDEQISNNRIFFNLKNTERQEKRSQITHNPIPNFIFTL